MDSELREMMRRGGLESISAEELIARRSRAGLCVLCAKETDSVCLCMERYLYKDVDKSYRLRRDQRSTLPCGIITEINSADLAVGVLMFLPNWSKSDGYTKEVKIRFDKIVDWDMVVLEGDDVPEDIKRVIRDYMYSIPGLSEEQLEFEERDKVEY